VSRLEGCTIALWLLAFVKFVHERELCLRCHPPADMSDCMSLDALVINLILSKPAADEDMLIGRAQGNGGSFIFTRDTEWEAEHVAQQSERQPQPHVQAA